MLKSITRFCGLTQTCQVIDTNNAISGIQLPGENADDWFGASVADAGDFNADGVSDLIIGAWYADPNGALSGAAYILFGNNDTHVWGNGILEWATIIQNKQGVKIAGEAAGDEFGRSVSNAGDFNGDGISDIIIGSNQPNTGPGAAYVLFGSNDTSAWGDGNLQLTNIIQNKQGIKISGEAVDDEFGVSVSHAGDFNADGISDLIIGACQFNVGKPGAAYILFGSNDSNAWNDGNLQWATIIPNKQGIKIAGETPGDLFGWSVSNAGNFNGNGASSLIIGAHFANPNGRTNAGAAYVLFGNNDSTAWGDGNLQWATIIQNKQGIKIAGEAENDQFGRSLSNAGDFNADGISDLIIGAYIANANGRTGAGAAYILFGNNDTNAWGDGNLQWTTVIPNKQGIKIAGEAAGDQFGISVSYTGDFNGDGVDDIVIGAAIVPWENIAKPGAAYVLFGSQDPNAWEPGSLEWAYTIENHKGLKIQGQANDKLGCSVTHAGDLNGDGISDLMIGAHQSNTGKSGTTHVVFGVGQTNLLNNQLQIAPGASTTFSPSNLLMNQSQPCSGSCATFEVFNASHLYFEMTNASGVPTSLIGNFTQEDINQGAIQVTHDGTDAPPSYSIVVKKQIREDQWDAHVIFLIEPPTLMHNRLSLNQGQSAVLTPLDLTAVYPGNLTLLSTQFNINNVLHGVFYQQDAQGQLIDNHTTTFTQEDLIHGLIVFLHDGSTEAPSYAVSAGDALGLFSSFQPAVIDFNLSPQLELKPFTIDQALDGGVPCTLLSPNAFMAQDTDTPDAHLFFEIKDPTHGLFSNTNNPNQTLNRFSNAQLLAGNVQFCQDGSDNTPSFTLRLNDTQIVTHWQVANLTLNYQPHLTLKSMIIDQTLNGRNPCNLLTQNIFAAQDSNNDNDQLYFEIKEPTHGLFSNNKGPNQALSRFSNAQLLAGNIQFCQDGSDNTPSFSIRLNDTRLQTEWQTANLTMNYRPKVTKNLAPQRVIKNRLFHFSWSKNIFSDPNGDTLTYTADVLGKAGLFDGLQFHAKQLAFSGKIDTTIQEEIVITATDIRQLSVSNSFFLVVDALELFLLKNHLNIGQGQSTRLTTDMLTSSSNIQTQYTFFIASQIQHGVFKQINPRNQSIEIANITRFSQRDIETSLIQFTHDGSPNPPQYQILLEGDSLDPYNAPVSVVFNALPLLYLSHSIISDQGIGTKILTPFLNATDQETALIDLLFEVNKVTYGHFEYESNPNAPITQFPQLLLMQGSIQFRHDGSDHRPFFSVRVFDGALFSDWQNTTATLNFKPQVRYPAQDQTVLQTYSLFSKTYAFEFSLNAFGHKDSIFFDPNDVQLTITAQLPGGAPLPAWIQFDSVQYRFQGETDTLIDQKIVLVAKDKRGLTAQSEFRLTSQMSDAAWFSKFGEVLGITGSISLAVAGYLFWRRRITRHRRTYPLANQIRKECNLHFNDFGRHLGDSFKIKVQMLIVALDYKHDNFYSRLSAKQKKQFAVCVANILQDHKLIGPADLFFGLTSWVFVANSGWPNDLDLDAFESQLPDIAREAVERWNHQNPNPGFNLIQYSNKDKLKACCFSRQCRLGFRGAVTNFFSKKETRTLRVRSSFSSKTRSSISLQALPIEPVKTQSPATSDLELTAVKTNH